MKYRVRTTVPAISEWITVEGDRPEDAANDFLAARSEYVTTFRHTTADRTSVQFALVEVEGHGEWITRTFSRGIWRRGVRRSEPSLATIAAALRCDEADLLAEGWEGEETEEQATVRKYGATG